MVGEHKTDPLSNFRTSLIPPEWVYFGGQNPHSPFMGDLICPFLVFSFFLVKEAKINKCSHSRCLVSLLCVLQYKESTAYWPAAGLP